MGDVLSQIGQAGFAHRCGNLAAPGLAPMTLESRTTFTVMAAVFQFAFASRKDLFSLSAREMRLAAPILSSRHHGAVRAFAAGRQAR